MNFRKNRLLAAALEKVWEATKDRERGDVVTHAEIEQLSGFALYAKGWGSLIKKLKARFEGEKGVTLWAEPTVGYRLLLAHEQLHQAPASRTRRAVRQLNAATRHLEAILDDDLSDHERLVRQQKLSGHEEAVRAFKRNAKTQEILGRSRSRPLEEKA